jgi:hypothetical protein
MITMPGEEEKHIVEEALPERRALGFVGWSLLMRHASPRQWG